MLQCNILLVLASSSIVAALDIPQPNSSTFYPFYALSVKNDASILDFKSTLFPGAPPSLQKDEVLFGTAFFTQTQQATVYVESSKDPRSNCGAEPGDWCVFASYENYEPLESPPESPPTTVNGTKLPLKANQSLALHFSYDVPRERLTFGATIGRNTTMLSQPLVGSASLSSETLCSLGTKSDVDAIVYRNTTIKLSTADPNFVKDATSVNVTTTPAITKDGGKSYSISEISFPKFHLFGFVFPNGP